MIAKVLFRSIVVLCALATLTVALGGCHTSPHRTFNKTFHNR